GPEAEQYKGPRLFRPDAAPPSKVMWGEVAAAEAAQDPAMSWEPGANSVPAMRRDARSTVPAEPTRDFPMDDAEERALAHTRDATGAAAAAEAAARPHNVVAPEAFDVPAPVVPWWLQVPNFRTNRRLQVLLGLGVVALSGFVFFPRGERPVTLADLRSHPDRFNEQDVKVNGRVGEVFPVGGGYAFYLHQGRDTMVVFTRTRTPQSRQNVKLTAHVSTGYLDGQPRLALFESVTPQK
ncbi:MAG: hypothetical protein ABIU54_03575, partial [Candidatus Eisenbacteria bacterium]